MAFVRDGKVVTPIPAPAPVNSITESSPKKCLNKLYDKISIYSYEPDWDSIEKVLRPDEHPRY